MEKLKSLKEYAQWLCMLSLVYLVLAGQGVVPSPFPRPVPPSPGPGPGPDPGPAPVPVADFQTAFAANPSAEEREEHARDLASVYLGLTRLLERPGRKRLSTVDELDAAGYAAMEWQFDFPLNEQYPLLAGVIADRTKGLPTGSAELTAEIRAEFCKVFRGIAAELSEVH